MVARINNGALFYAVVDKAPAFRGFFVAPGVALSVAHNDVFGTPADFGAMDSAGATFSLHLAHYDKALDFAVLTMDAARRPLDAFFPIVEGRWGDAVAVTTMRLGDSTPRPTVCKATIMAISDTHFELNGSTWGGGSGSAVLNEDGVIGMRQVVVDEWPADEVDAPAAGAEGGAATGGGGSGGGGGGGDRGGGGDGGSRSGGAEPDGTPSVVSESASSLWMPTSLPGGCLRALKLDLKAVHDAIEDATKPT